MSAIKGLHHITAIAGNALENHRFYTKVLGLRLVKKTVNFDDPGTYHFYYGNETGSPGTILTFFPWEGISPGRRGLGMATEFGYSVPENSFDFWIKRFEENNVTFNNPAVKFNEQYLTFLDPDGLKIELVAVKDDDRKGWTDVVDAQYAIKGFHHVTLSLADYRNTADLLTEVFGYELAENHVNRYRFRTNSVQHANIIDIAEVPGEPRGVGAGGTIHHIAFCVESDEVQKEIREKLLSKGFDATPVIDRNYFHSVYLRERGGVLFEIATANPGFMIDEAKEELGHSLKLPSQYEKLRQQIEKSLPVIS